MYGNWLTTLKLNCQQNNMAMYFMKSMNLFPSSHLFIISYLSIHKP